MTRRKWIFAIAAVVVAVSIVAVLGSLYWFSTPGAYEQRFASIKVGMTEKEVQEIMGSDGDSTAKKYRITGDERQRLWVVTERGYRLQLVVVFDTDSRVLTKDIYKTRLLDEMIFKDM